MIKDTVICREVFNLLTKLSSGWRRAQKDKGIIVHDGTCAQLLEKYKVNRLLNLIWTVDILQQKSEYVQVMKVWDIVTRSDIPKLAKRLDIIIGSYTVDKMNRCKHKCIERCVCFSKVISCVYIYVPFQLSFQPILMTENHLWTLLKSSMISQFL